LDDYHGLASSLDELFGKLHIIIEAQACPAICAHNLGPGPGGALHGFGDTRAHHGAEFASGFLERIGDDDGHVAGASLRGFNPDHGFGRVAHGFNQDGIDTAFNQRGDLGLKNLAQIICGDITHRFQKITKRPDVAQHPAIVTGRGTGHAGGSAIQFRPAPGQAVGFEGE